MTDRERIAKQIVEDLARSGYDLRGYEDFFAAAPVEFKRPSVFSDIKRGDVWAKIGNTWEFLGQCISLQPESHVDFIAVHAITSPRPQLVPGRRRHTLTMEFMGLKAEQMNLMRELVGRSSYTPIIFGMDHSPGGLLSAEMIIITFQVELQPIIASATVQAILKEEPEIVF